jgi:DNA-binding MarR family transcriptional regulator
LLLGTAGYAKRGWATVSELAEFLQERHNAVVGLVERAARRGLVRKRQSARDRRFVQVRLTLRGENTLKTLAQLHLQELRPAGPALARVLRALTPAGNKKDLSL